MIEQMKKGYEPRKGKKKSAPPVRESIASPQVITMDAQIVHNRYHQMCGKISSLIAKACELQCVH